MGLASGKAKLKLIDIESKSERDFTRPRGTPSPTNAPLNSQSKNHPAPDDAETSAMDGATEIGHALHEARERSGQSLQDASRNLRIRLEYLRAIESGHFKSLPGMTYAIGYVRSYAQYLGLDVERAISLFKAEARDLNEPRQLVFPSPAPEGKVPGGALMFIAAFLAIVGYAGWYYVTDSGKAVAGYTLAVPDALQSWLDEKTDGGTSGDGFTSTAVAASQESSQGSSLGGSGESSERSGTLDTATIDMVPITDQSATEPSVPMASIQGGTLVQVETSASVISASAIPTSALSSANPTPVGSAVTTPEPTITSIAPRLPGPPVSNKALVKADPIHPVPAAPVEQTSIQVAAVASEIKVETEPTIPQQAPAAELKQAATPADIPQAPEMQRPSLPTAAAAATTRSPIVPVSSTTGLADPTRVIIRASAASWVQVRAADSTTVMTKVMRAGDTYVVPDRNGLRLFTGNAGALTILIDGQAIPKIGGIGQIARNIDLEPETLRLPIN